ncbi:hypothetical protein CEXT_704491 [Caerostris extrusa]|uniref:Uncharacterized protein n=1 Tax=Caerostris extrusa TaxID=172846 RepID=A0AAV4NT23_CAEEX|nr:hypothetical protein CEXT_704491 [Caerostris extrusa]
MRFKGYFPCWYSVIGCQFEDPEVLFVALRLSHKQLHHCEGMCPQNAMGQEVVLSKGSSPRPPSVSPPSFRLNLLARELTISVLLEKMDHLLPRISCNAFNSLLMETSCYAVNY